jgi:hypothetical protein
MKSFLSHISGKMNYLYKKENRMNVAVRKKARGEIRRFLFLSGFKKFLFT